MANPLLIKAAVQILANPSARRLAVGIITGVLVIVMVVMFTFSSILSGLFAFFVNTNNQSEWARIMAHLEDTFSGIGSDIDINIKREVYEFMPEFSINLSKASISESFDNNFLLLYDSDEVETALSNIWRKSNNIRADINNLISAGVPIPDRYSFYFNDNSFMTADQSDPNAYTTFSDELLAELYKEVRADMPSYNYEITETEDGSGNTAKIQRLVTDDGNGFKSIVEYRQTGGGILYAPTLLAMFQAKQMTFIFNDNLSNEEQEQIEKDMETAFSELPENSENIPDDYTNEVWNGLNDFGNSGVGLLGVFQTNSLMSLLSGCIEEGDVTARTEYQSGDNYEKLTVILEIPSFDEWGDIFGLDEDQMEIARDNEMQIKKILDDANVPEADRYISLDSNVQAALFVYFQGFFNLPVESTALKSGGNGVLTALGDKETIHRYGNGSYGVYERGVTLNLQAANTPVKIELLPVGGCLEEVYIYDVCENSPDYIDRNVTDGLFHYPAVTLAFVINMDKFYRDYGFFFPIVKNSNGDTLYSEDEYLTMYLEFSCLDRLNVTERNIGDRLHLYSQNEPFVIGYAHNGLPSEARGDLSPDIDLYTHKLDTGNPMPHICVKTAFSSGLPYIISWAEDFGMSRGGDNYMNMRFNDVGEVFVNPMLWFKSFRTDLRGTAPLIVR